MCASPYAPVCPPSPRPDALPAVLQTPRFSVFFLTRHHLQHAPVRSHVSVHAGGLATSCSLHWANTPTPHSTRSCRCRPQHSAEELGAMLEALTCT